MSPLRNRFQAPLVACLLTLLSTSASAQDLLGLSSGAAGDESVAISLGETARDRLLRHLTETEAAIDLRLEQFNRSSEWATERLDSRRLTVESDLELYRSAREAVSPVTDPQMRQLLSELMRESQLILQIIRQIEDARDARLNGFLEDASTARHLRITLEQGLADIELATVGRADEELGVLQTETDRLALFTAELLQARSLAAETLSDRRNRLDEARVVLRSSEAESAAREIEGADAIQRGELVRNQVRRNAIEVAEEIAVADNERLVRKLTALSFLTVRRLGLLRSNAFGLASLGQALETRDLNVIAARILGRDLIRDNSGLALSAAMAGVRRGLQTALPEPDDLAREEMFLGYELARLRLIVQRLERQCELDRERLETVDISLEQVRLRYDVAEHLSAAWRTQREAAAAHEAGGVLSREPGAFDSESIDALVAHSGNLFGNPAEMRTYADEIDFTTREPFTFGSLLALVLAGLLTFLLGRRVNASLKPTENETRLDLGLRRSLQWTIRVLPATVVIILAMALELLPPAVEPLAWWLAIVITTVTALRPLMITLLPIKGTEYLTAGSARYLRNIIRFTVQVGLLLNLVIILMPLFGFPDQARQPIWGAFLVTCVLGLTGVLMRQRAVLNLFGSENTESRVALVLRRSVQRLYPLLVLGPIASLAVYLFGYRTLAKLIIGRGLLVLAVLAVFPWLNTQLLAIGRRITAFPNGGGPLMLSEHASKVSFRLASPLISLFTLLTAFAVLAAGWGYQGDLVQSLTNPLTYPLLNIGETSVTPLSIVIFVGVIGASIVVIRWVLNNLRERVYPLYDLTPGMRASIDTLTKYLLFFLGFIFGLKSIGLSLGFLAVFAGIIGIGIGFGSQTLMANFIAGLILQFTRPVEVGDEIEVEGVLGTVVRITSYSTVVRTYDNLSVVVPNAALLGNPVVNWSEDDRKVRVDVNVGVAYGSDVELVRELLLKAGNGHDLVRTRPAPDVVFDDFGGSSLDFTLRVWIDDPPALRVIRSDLRWEIERLFRESDIEIPFPQRDLHLRSTDATLKVVQEQGWDVVSSGPADASADPSASKN